MWDLCFLLLILNISSINTTTQLFTLKDKRIVGEQNNAEENTLLEDEVFFIISQASTQKDSSLMIHRQLAFDPSSG